MDSSLPSTTVKFDGALTVPNADALHARLVAALDRNEPVLLDLSGATDIDVAFLQLVVAAQKTASAKNIALSLRSDGAKLLMDEAARCGLSATAGNGTRVLPPLAQGIPA